MGTGVVVEPAAGGSAETILDVAAGRLGILRLRAPIRVRADAATAWFLAESGAGRLEVGGHVADVPARADPFSQAGWSALLGTGDTLSLEGQLTGVLVWRPGGRPDVTSALMAASSVPEEARGGGASARRVRTYIPRGPIIAGETLNPAGGWSSYPPHRHEHEEVYLYRFWPASGFGLAAVYGDDHQDSRIVHDGDVQRITSGYHPVVAAPGYEMYYLWALAGADELQPELDPVHAERS